MSVFCRVACELVSLVGFHTQHCHPTPTWLRQVYFRLTVTCHLHFWQNTRGLLRATAVTQGGAVTEIIRFSTESYPGEENSPAAPARDRSCDVLITSPASTTKI